MTTPHQVHKKKTVSQQQDKVAHSPVINPHPAWQPKLRGNSTQRFSLRNKGFELHIWHCNF